MARHCSCPGGKLLGNPSRSLEHASTMLRASGLNCQTFDLREMVAVSARRQLQDANGGHSWTARLPGNVSQAFTCSKRRKPRSLPKRCISRTMHHVRGSHRTLTSSTKPLTTAGMSGRRSDVSFPASKRPIRRRTLLTSAVNALFKGAVSVEPENSISNTEVL